MGEIADMMLDGTLCECCGVALDGEAPGYPRYCSSKRCRKDRSPPVTPPVKKTPCPTCGKRVKPAGLLDHMRDAHASSEPADVQ